MTHPQLGEPYKGKRFTLHRGQDGEIHITDAMFPDDASLWPANAMGNTRGEAAIHTWIEKQLAKGAAVTVATEVIDYLKAGAA
jgi:hypothetical protein